MTNKSIPSYQFAPEDASGMAREWIENGSVCSRKLFALLFCLLFVGIGTAWGTVLFHETFGNNTGSARTWSDSYSVKSGVSAVYSGITGYTVSNCKQGKNTTGSTQSGLNQTTQGTDAYIIIGPLSVASYSSLGVTYQWKAASIKGTYTTKLYYATSSGGSYTEVAGTGTGATTFVERSYSLPVAAQVSTLYLKIVWNTSNTQAIIDEVELVGTAAASCDKKVTIVKGTPETGGSFNLDKTGAQDCCSALTVTVSNITAPSGKEFDAITQSGIATGVTINQSSKTVTYAANSTGTSTINVTFRDLPKYTVTLMDDGDTRTQASYGASVTLPSRTGCTGYTFAGWTKTWVAPQSSWTTTAPTIIPAGSYTPSANENLYPVYTKTEGGEEEETEIFATTSLGSTNTVTTGYAVSAAAEAKSGYYQDGSGTTRSVSVRKSSTATAMISSIPTIATVTATLGGGSTKDPLTNNVYAVWLDASGNELGDAVQITSKITNTTGSDFTANLPVANATSAYGVRIKHQKETSYNVRYYAISLSITTGGSTTSYISVPNCCTPLGSINGSFSWSNVSPTSVTVGVPSDYSDKDNANLEGYIFKRYTASTGGSAVETIETNDPSETTATFNTGLVANTTYYYTIIAKHSSSSCNSAETSPRKSYTITSYTVSYANGGGSGTNPGAHSPVLSGTSVTLKANTFTAPAGKEFAGWNDGSNDYNAGVSYSVTGNKTMTAQWTCITPSISVQPSDASYTKDDTPKALSVTASGGTLSYQWKQSATENGEYSNVASGGTSSTYSPSTGSVGTTYYKCVVTNTGSSCNTTVTSDPAEVTVSSPAYFTNGATVFIQANSKDYSAWKDDACVKAWFNASGAGGAAQTTYWLFDATDTDAGKKLFAAIVPSTGDLNQVTLQRFQSDCLEEHWYNNNGTLTQASSSGVNTFRSYGSADNNIAWNGSSTTLSLYGNQNSWASSLATFADQGSGVWTATISNYAPDATSKDYKIKTSYNNGWIGNTGSNNNATLSGMIVGSTYNVTATLNVTDHSLVMSKEFVKGTVHFDLQDHGLAISDLENVAAGSKISAPSAPSATGYTFGGWYKEPACTNAWTFASDEVNETMTLYAKWTANVYTITKTFSNVTNASLPASFTYTGRTTTTLNSTFAVDATNFFLPSSITVTMGGTPLTAGTDYTYNNSTGEFTFDRIISGNIVITASATAKLKSIAITTQPTTRKYFAGESFSSTGAVVTATMGDGSTKAVTASATWTPPATPLAAGTGLTVTASYTENAINMTATTTIDVYSVTVNKKNEDGDAISADGVTATWTVGTKALAASATSASKYVFKQWEVTGASIGSTSSANTTLSNPTANVVVNAVFWKPRTVKWSVNGNDSYASSETVAYNGTISTVPSDPSGLACASTFVAWTDAAHNNGQTAKDDASYYGSALYTDAGDFPNITAETTTFYAVFAEKTNSDGYKYIGDDGTLADGKKYIFVNAKSAGSAYALKATDLAAPNSGNNGTAVSVTVTSNAEGVLVTTINTALEFEYVSSGTKLKYEVDGPATRYLFINGDGVGMKSDDSRSRYTTDAGLQGWNNKVTTYYDVYYNSTNEKFERKESAGSRVYAFIKQTAIYGNYVTECDANIVSVTYDANGGSTSCTNTTTDKTEDFTVCSSAPTRDYYTFAGWLCSADSKTYAASATIDDAVIDADFTLTAQWTPVTYNITYELDGGTNNVGNPATYNVTTATITLQDPTKGHDRFDGWYKTYSAGVYSNPVTSIPLGSHGDITLYAKWAARHEIIFDADGATTTIYRADDEALNASVAGQGSIPANPSAPSACSSKVYVGWVAEEIDGETDDEPTFLDVTSKVNADKHYYAVWATSVGNSIAAVEDVSFTGGEYTTYFSKTYGLKSNDKYVYKNSIWTSSDMTAGTKVKIKVKHLSNSSAATLTIALINSSGTVVTSTTLSTTANSNNIDNAAYSSNVELIATTAVTGYQITLSNIGSSSGVVILAATREVVATRSAYSTSCCATKVTLSENSPEHGTIAFGKTSVGTCGGDKDVTLTITPAAGYQLHSYEVTTGSGKVATKSVSPAISLDNNSSAAQNITLTFAEDANGAYDVTAAFSLMTVTSWAWTLNSAAIPDPLNLYVGQSARLDVAYTPAGVDASKKTYTRNKVDAYINWSGAQQSTYSTISGRASTGDNTTAVTFTHADGPTKTVNVKVLPLPLTHFVDLVHGKAFADVAATIEANALSATKTTPTSDDWTTPNANTCEENHLHLVGWIREDWPALVAYLNGTGDAPTTVAITGAGNDGEGHAYFFAPNASINVQTFNGVTFYAVWAQIE